MEYNVSVKWCVSWNLNRISYHIELMIHREMTNQMFLKNNTYKRRISVYIHVNKKFY